MSNKINQPTFNPFKTASFHKESDNRQTKHWNNKNKSEKKIINNYFWCLFAQSRSGHDFYKLSSNFLTYRTQGPALGGYQFFITRRRQGFLDF